MSEPEKKNSMDDKILEVKNLRVSFWTNNGTVKAVRGISFSLYRGKTLAIVGESGSGKSVTSRAIMGILAPNRIVEEGEILYDGRDILRLSEDELTKIRGSRIAMIFQDPMSSLNPIMRVGKQITEAMMLKRKAEIREGKATVRLISKGLMVADPTIKADLQALKSKTKEGEALPAVDETRLLAAAKKVIVDQEKNLRKGRQEAIAYFSHLAQEHYFSDYKTFLGIKAQLGAIKAKSNACKDRYSAKKDDQVYTFLVSFKYAIESYQEALKRQKKADKIARANARKVAKGGSGEMTIKQQAWASEIVLSTDTVTERAKDLVLHFVDHLKSINDLDDAALSQQADDLIAYLKKAIAASQQKVSSKEFNKRAVDVMREVGIPEPEKRLKAYPFQFSGGMRQRIVIAIALSSNPEILICDEPTTALDVTIQAQILDLINDLKKTRNLSVIFITHNLGVVANMADDIAIMYAGRIVEYGAVDDIFYNPKHPYTWALLNSMPDLDTKERLDAIPGTPPNMIVPPKGDAFAARNKYALKVDYEAQPPFFQVSPTHYAATWLLDPRSPKVDPPTSVTERIKRFQALNERMKQQKEKQAKAEAAYLSSASAKSEPTAAPSPVTHKSSKKKGGKAS